MGFDTQTLGDGYPVENTEAQIATAITSMQQELSNQSYATNYVVQLMPLIQLGLFELEKRKNRRLTFITQIVAGVSALVAVVALGVALTNTFSSASWMEAQLGHLERIQAKVSSRAEQRSILAVLQHMSISAGEQEDALIAIRERLDKELCVKQLAAGPSGELKDC